MNDVAELIHEVIVDGLADPSPSGEQAFHAAMRTNFGVEEERSRALVAKIPWTVVRTSSLEDAQRAAEGLRRAGATVRVAPTCAQQASPAQPPPRLPDPPSGSMTPRSTAATPPTAASPASAATIPLAGAATAATVLCLQCGALQPTTNKACARCSTPLARRTQPAPSAAVPIPTSLHLLPARSPVLRRDVEVGPCKAVLVTASALIFLGAASSLLQMIVIGEVSPAGIAGMLLWAGFGFWIRSGSKAGRVTFTVLAGLGIIGAFVVGVLFSNADKLMGSAGLGGMEDALGFLGTLAIAQSVFLAFMIGLIWGRGSSTKALALGLPCFLIVAWSSYATTLGSGAEHLRTLTAGAEAMAELQEATHLVQTRQWGAAKSKLEPIIETAREDENDVLLGKALALLGAAQAGSGDMEGAVASLEEAVEYLPENQELEQALQQMYDARDARQDFQQQGEASYERSTEDSGWEPPGWDEREEESDWEPSNPE